MMISSHHGEEISSPSKMGHCNRRIPSPSVPDSSTYGAAVQSIVHRRENFIHGDLTVMVGVARPALRHRRVAERDVYHGEDLITVTCWSPPQSPIQRTGVGVGMAVLIEVGVENPRFPSKTMRPDYEELGTRWYRRSALAWPVGSASWSCTPR